MARARTFAEWKAWYDSEGTMDERDIVAGWKGYEQGYRSKSHECLTFLAYRAIQHPGVDLEALKETDPRRSTDWYDDDFAGWLGYNLACGDYWADNPTWVSDEALDY